MYPSGFDEINGIFVHKQVKELKKQGCEVIVVSPVPYAPFPVKYLSKKWKKYSQIPKKAILEDIEIYYPRYLSIPKNLFFASSGIRMYLGVKKTIAEIYKNFVFDCIHSHVALPDGYAGMMIAKKYKKPLIVTIHGGDLQYTIFKNKKCKKNIEKVINFSKKTIVVSNKLKKNGEKELNILPNKTIVIPNGIDIKDIYKGKSNLIKQYEDKKNGLLVEPKNTNSLIKALDFLLSSPEIAKNIGQEARKIVLENYTWKIVVKKMINVYNLCFLKK